MESKYIIIILIVLALIFIMFFYDILSNKIKEQSAIINNIVLRTNDITQKLKEQFIKNDKEEANDNDILKFIKSDKQIEKYNKDISLETLEKFFILEHNIALNGHSMSETASKDIYYFYGPFIWSIENEWLIESNNKYYIPEGLIKIKKGTKYSQEKLILNKDLEIVFYKLYLK